VKEKSRGKKDNKTKRVRVIGIYLEPETYENIKAKSGVKCISMSDVMRQVLVKTIKAEERV
jgi:uncharacterized protein YerC